jgi:hypothetical protein
VTDASKPAAAERGHLRRNELFPATPQAGGTGLVNTFVKTDASFKQRRMKAEDSHDRRKLIPSPLPYRWSKSGECLFVNSFDIASRLRLVNDFDETHRFASNESSKGSDDNAAPRSRANSLARSEPAHVPLVFDLLLLINISSQHASFEKNDLSRDSYFKVMTEIRDNILSGTWSRCFSLPVNWISRGAWA